MSFIRLYVCPPLIGINYFLCIIYASYCTVAEAEKNDLFQVADQVRLSIVRFFPDNGKYPLQSAWFKTVG